MAKLTKRQKLVRSQVDLNKVYPFAEAVALLQKYASAKFVESVELAVNLGIDARKSDQTVRGATVLPHGTGKTVRVAVFTNDPESALSAGADVAGLEDLVASIKGGDANFDVVIATQDVMRVVAQVAQVLGPKGLMPNPKVGTVVAANAEAVATAVKNAKSGQVRYRNDKAGIVHAGIGKVNFQDFQLQANATALLNALRKAKPANAKGVFLQKATLSTTQGFGLQVDLAELE